MAGVVKQTLRAMRSLWRSCFTVWVSFSLAARSASTLEPHSKASSLSHPWTFSEWPDEACTSHSRPAIAPMYYQFSMMGFTILSRCARLPVTVCSIQHQPEECTSCLKARALQHVVLPELAIQVQSSVLMVAAVSWRPETLQPVSLPTLLNCMTSSFDWTNVSLHYVA